MKISLPIIAAVTILLPLAGRAQVGNDNPTGISGAFNGNVTTAGSYDPYTGNATRSVTDIVVAGSVGAYPLAFTRTANSRYTPGLTAEFGEAGSWRHSYQWEIDSLTITSNAANKWTVMPGAYTVNYPDGRRLFFSRKTGDSMMRSTPGVSDRFQPPPAGGGDCFVLLPDGGKVWFTVVIERWGDDFGPVTSTFDFYFNGIIDPHGQVTTVSYPGDGSLTITEPAGRWLKLFYTTTPWLGNSVVDRVDASDGRSVKYNYGGYTTPNGTVYTYLGNVVYYGDQSTLAIYSYQNGNVDPNGRPLLQWCIDTMYGGTMWAIAYSFLPPDAGGVYGQLQSENYLNPATGAVGAPVSSLSVNGTSRTETRGDGPTRTFNYYAGKLVSHTDFRGHTSSISYDGNGFTSAFTNARGKTTTTIREGLLGALSVLRHPDPEQSTQGYSYRYANGAPYFVQIRGDERGHNTYFTRDGSHRVTRIDYPDYPNGAYEEFTYNGFGQVLTHRLTTGGTKSYQYDSRGLLSAATSMDGTTSYFYDSKDRLQQVTDPRGNSTWFQYNLRGQITRVTHMDGSFVQMAYDNHGDCISVTDELNHTTRYVYDDYKRVISVTNPLNQTAPRSYAPWSGTGSYSHTSNSVYRVSSPLGKAVDFDYDPNFARTVVREGPGTADDAWTLYGYDEVGNVTFVQDPRGNITSFEYDARNRRIATRNALFQTTTWNYDTTSNVTRETRPDLSFRRAQYDSMNRVTDTWGFANEHIHYGRDQAGKVTSLTDPKGAIYRFYYDALGRKASQWYPVDATGVSRYDAWYRDGAGNIYRHDSPEGNVQIFEYDNRNRMYHSYWWGHVGPEVTTQYDAAGRVTSVVTNGGETTLSYGYDNANRRLWEEQTVAGYPTRRVEHGRDADGNAINTHIPGWYLTWQTYTQRNQLAQIQDNNGTPWYNFSYDPAGNLKKRQAVYAGVNDSTNIMYGSGASAYDVLNRPSMWENTGSGDNPFARSWHQYDSVSRMVATWRDEQGSKGERFGYDPMGQLTTAVYDADQVWTGNPQNPQRSVDYDVDALNRWSVWDSAAPTANGLSATYYSNIDLTGMAVLRNDASVSFDWTGGSPAPGIPSEYFSVRWEGHVVPRYSETYTFYTQSDDGVRLWVNGQLMVDNWTHHGWTENAGTITLAAGRKYDIRLEYFQGVGGAAIGLLWSSPSQGKEVIPSSQLLAARPANGLSATYYDNMDFTGTRVLRTDPAINFNWGVGSPEPAIDPETFSARWEGQIVPRYSETYTFYAGSDDGVRLWINGQLVVDAWYDRAYTESAGTITLVAGQSYDIRMDYYEKYSGALASLSWASFSQPKEIVPQSQLFLPSGGGNYRSNALNQYTSVGGQLLGYDTHFNLVSYDGATFSFNAQNQLTSASKGTNAIQFTYDGLGRCLKRTINGAVTIFAYDGWKSIAEWAGDGSWWGYRIYGAGPDELLWNYDSRVGPMRVHTDVRGNVTALLDWSGNGIEKYTYDAFGRPTITDWNGSVRGESAVKNRFLFQGREWIAELGVYDFRFRHYQPDLGRFLQSDPIRFAAGDSNLFRYCGGDPINGRDPFGLADKKYQNEAILPGVVVHGDPTPPSLGSQSNGTPLGGPGDVSQGMGEGMLLNGIPAENFDWDAWAADDPNAGAPEAHTPNVTVWFGPHPPPPPAPGGSGGPGGVPGGTGENLGSLYDYRWLRSQLARAGVVHRDRLAGLQQVRHAANTFALGASLVVAAPVAGPLALDAVYTIGWQGLVPAANAAYYALHRYPNAVVSVQQFANAFTSPGWDASSKAAFQGSFANASLNAALQITGEEEIGP